MTLENLLKSNAREGRGLRATFRRWRTRGPGITRSCAWRCVVDGAGAPRCGCSHPNRRLLRLAVRRSTSERFLHKSRPRPSLLLRPPHAGARPCVVGGPGAAAAVSGRRLQVRIVRLCSESSRGGRRLAPRAETRLRCSSVVGEVSLFALAFCAHVSQWAPTPLYCTRMSMLVLRGHQPVCCLRAPAC